MTVETKENVSRDLQQTETLTFKDLGENEEFRLSPEGDIFRKTSFEAAFNVSSPDSNYYARYFPGDNCEVFLVNPESWATLMRQITREPGKVFQTTRENYYSALGSVPPIDFANGFACGEIYSHTPSGKPTYFCFSQIAGKYFATLSTIDGANYLFNIHSFNVPEYGKLELRMLEQLEVFQLTIYTREIKKISPMSFANHYCDYYLSEVGSIAEQQKQLEYVFLALEEIDSGKTCEVGNVVYATSEERLKKDLEFRDNLTAKFKQKRRLLETGEALPQELKGDCGGYNARTLRDSLETESAFDFYGLNERSRAIVWCFREVFPKMRAGKVNLYDKDETVFLSPEERIYNFGCSFVVPEYNGQIEYLILERHHSKYTGTKADSVRVNAIFDLIEKAGGFPIFWN